MKQPEYMEGSKAQENFEQARNAPTAQRRFIA
jgi:hypothetical protein